MIAPNCGRCVILPSVTFLVPAVTLLLQPLTHVTTTPALDQYIVAEYGAYVLSKIAGNGDEVVVYRFEEGTWPLDVAIYVIRSDRRSSTC